MSTTQDPDDDGGINLADLWSATKDNLDRIHDDPVKTGELANEFIPKLAEAVHDGGASKTEAEPLIKQFARNASIKKSVLDNQFEDEIDKLDESSVVGNVGNPSGPDESIVHVLNSDLRHLTIYMPTDASAESRYYWEFQHDVEFETETEHLSTDSFCQKYHEATGGERNVVNPSGLDGSWTDYIRNLIAGLRESDKTSVVPVEGVRTQAVEDLKNTIENKPATTNLKDSAQQYRPFLVAEDADEVQVPSAIIERVISDFDGVDYNDLQIELDKLGHRSGNVRSTQVGPGVNVRLWRLDREWLDIDFEEGDEEDGETNGDDQ